MLYILRKCAFCKSEKVRLDVEFVRAKNIWNGEIEARKGVVFCDNCGIEFSGPTYSLNTPLIELFEKTTEMWNRRE